MTKRHGYLRLIVTDRNRAPKYRLVNKKEELHYMELPSMGIWRLCKSLFSIFLCVKNVRSVKIKPCHLIGSPLPAIGIPLWASDV